MKQELLARLKTSTTPPSGDKAPGNQQRLPWFGTYLLSLLTAKMGWIVAFGLIGMIAFVFGPDLLPAKEVQLSQVIYMPGTSNAPIVHSSAQGESVKPLFQATGWLEADPYPTKVTALADGVVERVLVNDGDEVTQGQLLAVMVEEDRVIARDQAQAAWNKEKHALSQAQSNMRMAIAMVDGAKATLEVEASRESELSDLYQRASKAGAEALSEQLVAQARLKWETQQAVVQVARAKLEEARENLLGQQNFVNLRKAAVEEAYQNFQAASLALKRMHIHAPFDAVIQKLHVVPGQVRMAGIEAPNATTIATLFRPDHLQVRVDVPLADVARVTIGQPARVRTEFLNDRPLMAKVVRIAGQADIQRNTLEVKVSLDAPPPNLKPDMLCRVEFLPARTSPEIIHVDQENPYSIWVPTDAIRNLGGNNAFVWTPDEENKRLVKKPIVFSEAPPKSGFQEILSGLMPGEKVVLQPGEHLSTGDRFRNLNLQ